MTIFVVKYLCVQKNYNKDNISSIFFGVFIIVHIQKIFTHLYTFFLHYYYKFFYTRVHARCLQQAVVRVFFLAAAAAASEVICITS